MNAITWLSKGQAACEAARRAVLAGVHGHARGDYCAWPYARQGLLPGLTGVGPHQLVPGLEALARVVSS